MQEAYSSMPEDEKAKIVKPYRRFYHDTELYP